MSADERDNRFWDRVEEVGHCWLWTGAKTLKGYGQLRRNGRHVYAHRHALELTGVDIAGRQVDHICHNRACVRPEHLRLATNKQNSENLTGPYANSKSGIRGVWWDRRGRRWVATVGHNGTQHRKGFPSIEQASEWVRLKRLELFTHSDADKASA